MKILIIDIEKLPREFLKSVDNIESVTVHVRGHLFDLEIDNPELAEGLFNKMMSVWENN